jgi:hypothetical protein
MNVEGEDAQTRARPSEYRDQTIRILLDQTPIQDQKVRLNPLNLPSQPGGRSCIPDNLEAQIVHEQESEGPPHRNFAISYDGSDLAPPLSFPFRWYGEELAERARQVESLLPGEKSGFLPGQLTR